MLDWLLFISFTILAAALRSPWQNFVRGSFVTTWFLGFLCIIISSISGLLMLCIMRRIEHQTERFAEESQLTRLSIEKLGDRIDNAMERRG